MGPIVVVIKDNIVDMCISCDDVSHAEQVFRHYAIQNYMDVTDDDLDNGYIEFFNGSVCITTPIIYRA